MPWVTPDGACLVACDPTSDLARCEPAIIGLRGELQRVLSWLCEQRAGSPQSKLSLNQLPALDPPRLLRPFRELSYLVLISVVAGTPGSMRLRSAFLLRTGAILSTSAVMSLSTTAAAAAPKFVIATDGAAAPSTLTSKEFLLSLPNGAYTTARTCARARRIFEWETHVTRTASSVASMLDASGAPSAHNRELHAALATPEALRPRLDATVATAVRQYLGTHGDDDELKVTVLVSWQAAAAAADTVGSVACHIAPLPRLPDPPVNVEVRGAPRSNAAAKDSSWVADRAPLEELMRAASVGDVNELLLATETGELLEGSQTNFYALLDGAVHTAGEGVLEGTVRRLLLEVCAREGIPVVLEPPKLQDAPRWQGALISSTSRLMLPIDKLFVPREGAPSDAADLRAAFDNGPGSLAARLRALVQGEVEAHSTEIGSLPAAACPES